MRGLIDWVPLQRIHYHVAQEHPGEPIGAIQPHVMDLIRELATEGFVEIGDLNGPDDKFQPWPITLEESMARIAAVYIDGFDKDAVWPWYVWVNLTPKGDAAAGQIDAAALS